MKLLLICCLALGLAVSMPHVASSADEKAAAEGAIAHDVYFTLKDSSPEARKKLVDACKKYLTKHPGTLYFGAGARAEDYKQESNDQEFDVALHIGFKNKEAYAKYRDSAKHRKFIEELKDGWKKVRVFDSHIEQPGASEEK
ncbi:MAG TPA: Dabb family protein [Gemmataceae bacterium]|jgi:hypothetical protein|nr:Dabb family protein [Gemmataceae bacterium]